MFQIAATVGAARRNGCPCVLPDWTYSSLFARGLPRECADPGTAIPYRETQFTYRAIDIDGPTRLVGFFHSERYFAHCADEIRALFAPRADAATELARAFSKLLAGPTCSLHVRRTDYTESRGYADLAATGYYARAMALLDPETTYLVFSDDIAWCKSNFSRGRVVFIDGMNALGSLFLMASCSDHIIANSTFSWWGAWLGRNPYKRVVAPAHWFAGDLANPAVPFRAGPPHGGFHDTRDLIPESWATV
jgi:hypothetical protein